MSIMAFTITFNVVKTCTEMILFTFYICQFYQISIYTYLSRTSVAEICHAEL